ncbi:hypothetical protein [Planktothricoides raciborskii]|uniref:Uncharacterized protein n=1 Tax=Planktothricoides raciborskii GIHE-MW2 TaxID=2792601 RepID=A0AAU8JFE6_9CYAN
MSQDPPNNRPRPERREPGENPRVRRNSPQPSVVKLQVIKLLRGAIAVLEGTVEKLEADPTAPLLPPAPIAVRQVLRPIRALLPAGINRQFSDWGLTSAIAGLLLVILLTTTTLMPPEPAEQIAQLPPETPTEITENPPQESEIPPEVQETESTEREIPENTSEKAELPPELPPETKTETTPESEQAIAESEPELFDDSITEEILPLTPEQILIASIENQVNQLTREYSQDLIKSINPDFKRSFLQVQLNDIWYNLTTSQQDKFASKLLAEVKGLDFSILEIRDGAENLVARSPVVGSQMIILRRSLVNIS